MESIRSSESSATESGFAGSAGLRPLAEQGDAEEQAAEHVADAGEVEHGLDAADVPDGLAAHGCDSAIVTGASTSGCVRATAVDVLQHGYAHINHATPNEKKVEIGPHRPAMIVLGELGTGWLALERLFGDRPLSIMVPPWNRIAPALVPTLPEIGFTGLSTFGHRRRAAVGTAAGGAAADRNHPGRPWASPSHGLTSATGEEMVAAIAGDLNVKGNALLFVNGFGGTPAKHMIDAGSVAELLSKVRHHPIQDTRVDRRRGMMVEIDRHDGCLDGSSLGGLAEDIGVDQIGHSVSVDSDSMGTR